MNLPEHTSSHGQVPGGRTSPSKPTELGELFWAFTVLSLQGFGGVLAVVHRELVDKRSWLTDAEFIEDWAVAQVMPGPNVCNLALVFGDRHMGWPGALSALAGLLVFPLLSLLAVATLFSQWADLPAVEGALRGMGAVAAGLIAGSALKLLQSLQQHALGRVVIVCLVVLAFVGTVVLHWPLHVVVLGLGSMACALTWRALRKQRAA